MNAMLNSQTGGTIYIGVRDGGEVSGLVLNQYKVQRFDFCNDFVIYNCILIWRFLRVYFAR